MDVRLKSSIAFHVVSAMSSSRSFPSRQLMFISFQITALLELLAWIKHLAHRSADPVSAFETRIHCGMTLICTAASSYCDVRQFWAHIKLHRLSAPPLEWVGHMCVLSPAVHLKYNISHGAKVMLLETSPSPSPKVFRRSHSRCCTRYWAT